MEVSANLGPIVGSTCHKDHTVVYWGLLWGPTFLETPIWDLSGAHGTSLVFEIILFGFPVPVWRLQSCIPPVEKFLAPTCCPHMHVGVVETHLDLAMYSSFLGSIPSNQKATTNPTRSYI